MVLIAGLYADGLGEQTGRKSTSRATRGRRSRSSSAVCVDVRPALNGKSLVESVDENSPESMQAVADALLATELPAELQSG